MPGGIIFLDSVDANGQAPGPDDIIQRLFDAIFESDPPLKVDTITARNYLANTRPLILLDEVPLSPALQRALPDLIPQGAFILTADLPSGGDFQRLAIGPLPRAEAVQLLAEKAGVKPDDTQVTTLKYICGLLSDISLAVTITGNIIRETGITPEAAFEALGAISVGGTDPVSMALDRAYLLAFKRLSDEERAVLSAAILTPGVSMTAEWLSAALGANAERAIERLKSLGLLYSNSLRLRVPDGFRAPARRSAVMDEKKLLSTLLEYLLANIGKGDDFISDELGNLFGALLWAVRAGRPDDVISLGRALDPYLTLHGLWDAWGQATSYVLDAARQSGNRAVEAWALHQLGTRLIGKGDISQATELLKNALVLRTRLGDSTGAAYTQHNLDHILPPPTLPMKTPPKTSLAGKILLGLLTVLLVGVVILWAISMLPPPKAPPRISGLDAAYPVLSYGQGAEDCGPTETVTTATMLIPRK
jgi:hypothetical protein